MNVKILAVFMSMLIIMLPITFAAQMGAFRELSIYGTDGTNGYRRSSNDKTVIDALVSIEGDTDISNTQLLAQGQPFDGCSDEGSGNFRCRYTERDSITYEPKTMPLEVKLYDDSGALSASKTGYLTIDVNPPEITSLSVKQEGNVVKLTYTVKDTACDDSTCANKCSGLKTIDISGYKIVAVNSSKCTYSGVESLELESGPYQLSVTAYDGVGNSATKSTESFVVDTSTVSEVMDTIAFIKNGKEYTYIGANGQKASDVVVYIEESSVAKVTGDLSPLNKVSTYKSRYSSLKAVCENLGGISKCVWKDIYVWPDSNTGTIELNVKDSSGNTAELSAGYSLRSDDSTPTVISIGAKCDGTRCYLREKNNTLIVKINEAGSGFNRTSRIGGRSYYNVGLNLGEVSSLYNIKKSERCENTGGVWNCYFYNIVADKGHGQELKVFISSDSADDAGNALTGKLEETFMVDIRAPVKKSLTIASSGIGYALEGDGLNLQLIVNDDTAITAVGHFGGLTLDASPKTTECAPTADKEYTCTWMNVGSIAPGPQTDVPYSIDVIDMAGNVLYLNETADIVEAEGLPKKYWMLDGNVMNSPSAISVDTLFKQQKAFFSIPLKSAVRDIKVISAALTNCSGNGLNFNKKAIVTGKNSIFLEALSTNVPSSATSLHADCTLRIVSVVNKVRLAVPQDLAIEMDVPLVSASLGTIDERVADKINSAKAEVTSGMNAVIDTLEKVFKIFDGLCTLFKTISSITSIFDTATVPTQATLDACSLNPLTAAECIAAAQKVQAASIKTGIARDLAGFANGPFCKFISCEDGLWGDGIKSKMTSLSKSHDLDIRLGDREIPDTGIWPNDPKNNLILSIMWGCIPGIIMNMKKMKNIQCMYIDCLQNQVPKGTPMKYCDEQLGYQQCRFVYGQLFDVLGGNMLKGVANFFKTLLNDPLSLMFGIVAIICPPGPAAATHPSAICRATASTGTLGKVLSAMGAITTVKKVLDDMKGADDACKKVGL